MAKYVRCGTLFTGNADQPLHDQTVTIEGSKVKNVGPTSSAPRLSSADELIDHSHHFVMPGLVDVHTHLAYGNAKTEENIDLYASPEFRALRGLFMAGRVLAAGYTSMADPGNPGRTSVAIRDAINAGLFKGPRITSAGQYVTSRQGLTDWYPTWIGVPETAIGHLVRSRDEAIELIRWQVKENVDFIKIAMDGDKTLQPTGVTPFNGLMAAFNQEETTAMITEAHRLGKKVAVHARGAEAVLYAARASADLIYHASWMDDAGLEAVIKNQCALCPTLTLVVNNIEFSREGDGSYGGWATAHREELEVACENLTRARKAGARFMTGTDSGFAVTPYGEWHAREIEIFVKYLGFSPVAALRCATEVSANFLREAGHVGTIEFGRLADLIAVDGNPVEDVTILQDRSRIKEVILGGETITVDSPEYDPRQVSDFSYNMWSDVYSRARVAELAARNH